MSKKKPKQGRRMVHEVYGDTFDTQMSEASFAIDEAADREWFRKHPNAPFRVRAASVRELAAAAFPPGTVAIVQQVDPDGVNGIMRVLLPPEHPVDNDN